MFRHTRAIKKNRSREIKQCIESSEFEHETKSKMETPKSVSLLLEEKNTVKSSDIK